MKARAWVKAVAESALLSPRTALRKSSGPKVNKQATADSQTSSIAPIPLQTLATLTRVIRFLDENHYVEEGLYRKRGVRLEVGELVSACRENRLTDLSLYSPHSIASAVKQILAEEFEPLIPSVISAHMLDAAATGRVDEQAEEVIMEKFKQIRSTTREFLQVFLNHLYHISVSGPCRMSATNLALHIGVVLVRPTEDTALLASKAMMRRRKAVAEFLIDRALSLPYDCATEMYLPAIPDEVATPEVHQRDANAALELPSPSPKQLNFVQVTWSPGEHSFTAEELESMFGEFGSIVNLGVNDQGNRAIIAYENAEGAEAAESAHLPGIRVRRRKPRQSKQPYDCSDFKSGHLISSEKNAGSANPEGSSRSTEKTKTPVHNSGEGASPIDSLSGDKECEGKATQLVEKHPSLPSSQDSEVFLSELALDEAKGEASRARCEDDVIVIEDIESDSIQGQELSESHTEMKTLPQGRVVDDDNIVVATTRVDILTEQHAHSNPLPSVVGIDLSPASEESKYEVKTSPSSSPIGEGSTLTAVKPSGNTSPQSGSLLQSRSVKLETEMALRHLNKSPELVISSGGETSSSCIPGIGQSTAPKTTSMATELQVSRQYDEEAQVLSDQTTSRKAVMAPVQPSCLSEALSVAHARDIEAHKPKNHDTKQASSTPPSHERLSVRHDGTQTLPTGSVDKATETLETGALDIQIDLKASPVEEPEAPVYVEALRAKLRDMYKILSTSTSALSASNPPSELEHAMLQLHMQILQMATDCLILADPEADVALDEQLSGSALNDEFLHFLEIQSKTQVKILQVEIRAGQELLRLHKSQHEKEREQLEEEMAALRVGRSEAERVCTDLRASLRNCRSELACHVANATIVKREKSALEEKLVDSENQRQAKDVAMAKLQAKYEDMHRVAAEAQMRVEKFKQSGESSSEPVAWSNQSGHEAHWVHLSSASAGSTSNSHSRDSCLPRTTKFFHGLQNRTSPQSDELSREERSSSLTQQERPSNVAALEAIRKQMAQDIQEQIATTKAALQEMEVCSANGKTLEEEEEELRALQHQLAATSSEMDSAMEESRNKLQELLAPNFSASPSPDDDNNGDIQPSDRSPSIFDATALVNELLARAEADSTKCSAQPIVGELFTGESFAFRAGERSHFAERNQPSPEDNFPTRMPPYSAKQHEAQSALYQRWKADRTRKMGQLGGYHDQQSVHRAQQSMQTFRQTLNRFRNEQHAQQGSSSK